MNQVCQFISAEIFNRSLPKQPYLLRSLTQSILKYHFKEKIICIALGMFAEGFFQQKGSIFGFGPNTSIPRNLSRFFDEHNISEEQNVGSFSYVCTIKSGSKHLQSTPRKVVLKSSFYILDKGKPVEFRKYRRQSIEID